ncbi:raffinose/stachyose/melibiose transport system permease protein [Diaminobutyricimonas aerilata]|uniref:Raffinose/stachyose/melibiose transport system permease protein n=1 Tax=Diaminobutyricimonas aerilata TaxID=1162967 RepID=A0A2M9CJL9_9MICO|nr:carbohydrate ABC transporter permease [Diaminobutyricimonas aerilata]PJJ72085.1 raffinose/stachyose/melibiose transport system permease protein [Diaminobutyricimonas aerilata]
MSTAASRPAPSAFSGRAADLLVAAFVLLIVVLQLVPFYVAITTSLKAKTDLSPQWSLPTTNLVWSNFVQAVTDGGILRAMGNSVLVAGVSTLFVCLLGAIAAYPLARRRSRFNSGILAVNVGLMMVPALSILVPLYSMLADMRALNTYWGVILVMIATNLPLAIFLYSSFMRSLPVSVEEAARIDGANLFQTLAYVVIPMLKPVTATVGIITGVGVWNEYALSGYILSTPETQTIAPAIASFFSIQSSNLPAATAASLIAVVPVVVAYLFLQKYFVRGLVGAEKG